MKKLIRFIIILTFKTTILTTVFAQSDSLVRFSDLQFHSDFEKEAFKNFVFQNRDTFNLFLAIDEKMAKKEANRKKEIYRSIFKDLEDKNIQRKNIKKRLN
jgi:hypothetical protein